jgi:hypothetical protein
MDIDIDTPRWRARIRREALPLSRTIVHVIVYGNPPPGWGEQRIRSLLTSGATGQGAFFIGQDARMLRQCITTPASEELVGGEFDTPFQFVDTGADTVVEEELPGGTVQVIRNGSIIASSGLMEPVEEDFWP